MNFEYLETITKESSIDIENIGRFYLQGFTDIGEEYYLCTDTKLGFTRIKHLGPFVEGKQCSAFSYITYEIEYNEGRLKKLINAFLNGKVPKTQVFEVDKKLFDDIISNIEL